MDAAGGKSMVKIDEAYVPRDFVEKHLAFGGKLLDIHGTDRKHLDDLRAKYDALPGFCKGLVDEIYKLGPWCRAVGGQSLTSTFAGSRRRKRSAGVVRLISKSRLRWSRTSSMPRSACVPSAWSGRRPSRRCAMSLTARTHISRSLSC
jgi:hypothetical protein